MCTYITHVFTYMYVLGYLVTAVLHVYTRKCTMPGRNIKIIKFWLFWTSYEEIQSDKKRTFINLVSVYVDSLCQYD